MKQLMYGSHNGALTPSMHHLISQTLIKIQLKHYNKTMNRAHDFKYQYCKSELKTLVEPRRVEPNTNTQLQPTFSSLSSKLLLSLSQSRASIKCSIVFNPDWVKNYACRIMYNLYPTFLKRLTIRLKRSEKLGFPMIF